MKRICSFLLIAALIITAIPFSGLSLYATTSEFAGGSGTETVPYLIETKYHLNNVRNYLDAHYKMIADIEFTEADFTEGGDFYNDGQGWTPIGKDEASAFTGNFDGNGHTIKNLYIKTSSAYVGLFGYNKGTIKNLGVIDGTVLESSYEDVFAGGITGYNFGTITNCYNTGLVVADDYAGGITGYSDYGTIKSCYNTGEISSDRYAGGVVGYSYNNGTIENCYNTGKIVSVVCAGGIVGNAGYYGTTTNCWNTGKIVSGSRAGGIVGATPGYGTISNCYNTGEISATSSNDTYAGGIAGSAYTIENCYNTGDISVTTLEDAYAGGIAGGIGDTIENCYNTGDISATTSSLYDKVYAGGIAGRGNSVAGIGSLIKNCYNTGEVFGTTSTSYDCDYVGGIVGDNTAYGTIRNCYYIDNISNGTESGADMAIKCTAEQMKLQPTYGDFGFERTWEFVEGNAYPYPTLKNNEHFLIDDSLEFNSGNGTEEAPYCIASAKQLNNVRKYLDSHFKLVRDIVFSDSDFEEGGDFYNNRMGWEPIGSSNYPFGGVFEGDGYQIINLFINKEGAISSDLYIGIFGYCVGTIKNLNVIDSSITVAIYPPSNTLKKICIGGIVGYTNGGMIENCRNMGSINSSITKSDSSGYYFDLTVGGIVGYLHNSSIKNCYYAGDIETSSVGCTHYNVITGGLVGLVNSSTITRSYNVGSISTNSTGDSYGGGIVGYIKENFNITTCYNMGSISVISNETDYMGGIVGHIEGGGVGVIEICYNVGSMACPFDKTTNWFYGYIGGIAGFINSGTSINCCYNVGEFSAKTPHILYMGGIVGAKFGSGETINCYYLNTLSKGMGIGTIDDCRSCSFEEMKNQDTFTKFDFEKIWTMDGNSGYPFPELQSTPMVFNAGDVNENGTVSVADSVILLKAIAGNINKQNIDRLASDVDHDGELTTADVVAILQLMLNKRYY